MNIGWVIKGHVYGIKFTSPTTRDTDYPEEYIWIDKSHDVAYILSSVTDGVALWIEREPDYKINVNTDTPVYFIGETYLGDSERGVPVVGLAGPQGEHGEKGDQGDPGTGGGGYNFLETTPTLDITTALASTTITGRTMRCNGTGTQEPTVTVNGLSVTVNQTVGDLNIYTFSIPATLSVGANSYEIVSDNGTTLTKTLVITRSAVAPSCALSHAVFFKAGTFTITLTTDYDLTVAPTLDTSVGSLSVFSGSGKVWTATLTITSQNGAGTFSNAVLVGAGGTGTVISSGASYTVDTVAPTIGTASFSTTLWHYETGAMTCTVAMGETTTGFTGQIDLSHFGLSASYTLSPSGNNMGATFTPARVNAGPDYGHNVRVSDRCGNAATPKADTDNQLQVVAYRLVLQNVTFPAYSAVSNALSGGKTVTTDANSHVSWGVGQTNTGSLAFTTDYVLDTSNRVHLDETKWADTISANALGLLNVDVYED